VGLLMMGIMLIDNTIIPQKGAHITVIVLCGDAAALLPSA
jgi:hypothetical protein